MVKEKNGLFQMCVYLWEFPSDLACNREYFSKHGKYKNKITMQILHFINYDHNIQEQT